MNDDKNSTPDQPSANTPPADQAGQPAAEASIPHPHDAPTVPVAPAVDVPPTATAGATTPEAATPAVAPPPASSGRSGRNRALLIGGGIAAALLLAGGGIAVGAAIADDADDDRPGTSSDADRGESGDRGPSGQGNGDGDRDRDSDDAQASQGGSSGATDIGTASADDLVAIAEAARGAAAGEVTAMDAQRDGSWEVELTEQSGAESEVRVSADLTATVISTDAADGDDSAPAYVLDDAAIRALVDAAFAEADGLITDLDVDDDAASPYDASVVTTDGRWIDIDFSADFAVVGTDLDD